MTSDEIAAEIGKAFLERPAVIKKIDCLRMRIRSATSTLEALLDGPNNEAARREITETRNPVQDWKELDASLKRLQELKKILS